MKKIRKNIYIGCGEFDYNYFKPNYPMIRLQKFDDGFYTREERKGMFYFIADLADDKFIFNLTKLKSKNRKRKGKKIEQKKT